ncbi:MAG: glycosyltransferase family 4 protein [Clostridium sp.]
MKLCFITSSISSIGGVQRVLTVLANELSKEYEVDIVLTARKSKTGKKSIYDLNEKINVKVVPELYDRSLLRKLIKSVNKKTGILNKKSYEELLKEILYPKKIQNNYIKFINSNNYDVVIGVTAYFSMALGIVADKVKSRTIGWQHNSYEAYLKSKGRYIWNEDVVFDKYIPKLYKYIVLNEHDSEMFKKERNIDTKVIYNPRSFKSDEKSNLDKKVFLAAGRFHYQKGFDLLIEAFSIFCKKNSDWNLVIVGDGEEKENIKELVAKYNIESRVSLDPFTNNIKEYFLNSSVLALSSRWEGMPMIVLEALEMGIPIVSFDITAIVPLVDNEKEGYIVKSYDVEGFANAMLKIVDSKEVLKKFSNNCIIKSKEFDMENIAKKWKEILDNN